MTCGKMKQARSGMAPKFAKAAQQHVGLTIEVSHDIALTVSRLHDTIRTIRDDGLVWLCARRKDGRMKDLNMLVWLTQLGLSVAVPLAGFTILGVWLRQRFALGDWVVVLGLVIGLVCAVDGFRSSLKAMERMQNHKPPRNHQ